MERRAIHGKFTGRSKQSHRKQEDRFQQIFKKMRKESVNELSFPVENLIKEMNPTVVNITINNNCTINHIEAGSQTAPPVSEKRGVIPPQVVSDDDPLDTFFGILSDMDMGEEDESVSSRYPEHAV